MNVVEFSTATPPNPYPADESRFVRQALATHLEKYSLSRNTEFHELSTSDQSAILRAAQELKRLEPPSAGSVEAWASLMGGREDEAAQ